MLTPLTIHLLGGVNLFYNGTALPTPKSRKGLALFLYLACTRRAHTREALADLLWDATSTKQSLSNLRTALSRLPAPLSAHLLISRETIAVDPARPLMIDAIELEHAVQTTTPAMSVQTAPRLAAALACYQGDFLEGLHVENAARFVEWLVVERERLRYLALDGYQQLIACYLQNGAYEEGIQAAMSMLRLEPTDEACHGQLMRMLAYTGQRAAALAQFETCRQLLLAAFGAEPNDALQALYSQIRDNARAAPSLVESEAPARRHNLPAQVTPLLGRQHAVAHVQALLQQAEVRLVTLTGPGGVGKSRLGEATAWTLLADFADGVFSIELAAVRDPHLVLSAIAQTLGVRDLDSTPLQQRLHEYLHHKQILLLVDNFEQVIEAASQVLALLRACPQLKVLVTSREALRLRGEYEFMVPTLAAEDAVDLFVQRAQAVRPSFTLEPRTASIVKTICQQLDYLPLAIELAAAHSKLFAPAAILARLQDRFAFLIGRGRDLPDRQHTLRATLDWSYELLTAEEKRLFRRMAVFIGGRSMAALETVCNPADDKHIAPLAMDLLNGLTALSDQSLLYQATDGASEPRFMMLVTIHEYALAQLASSGEFDALRRRHLDYYVALAERAEVALTEANQSIWLEQLESELDNVRAALEYALLRGEIELGARLCAALRRFWGMRGRVSEGRQWLSAILAQEQAISTLTKAKTFSAAGTLAQAQGDYEQAVTLQQEALMRRRVHGDQTGVAVSLNNLGFLAENQGDYAKARSLYEEVLALSRQIDYKLYIAIALINLGRLVHALGEYALVRIYAEESLALNRTMGNQWGIALALDQIGNLAFTEGDYVAARLAHEEALAIREGFGGKWAIATSLQNLGRLNQRQGHYDVAQTLYEKSLALRKEISDKPGIAGVLMSLGNLNHDLGDGSAAQAMLQQSLTMYRAIGEKAGIARALNALGWVNQTLGDLDAAQAQHEESLSMQRALGRQLEIAVALHYLANLALQQGHDALARSRCLESWLLLRELGEKQGQEQALRTIAQLFAQAEKLATAAQLFGAAAAIRVATGLVIPPRERAAYEQTLAAVRTELGEAYFATVWSNGHTMPLDQTVGYVLAELRS
ncbi:MAG: tetratricopeptide repeat protein [Caldilineaceae bacterium]|nr:tetratricopeptide repeat protein [Caldilineaceae bacterium]